MLYDYIITFGGFSGNYFREVLRRMQILSEGLKSEKLVETFLTRAQTQETSFPAKETFSEFFWHTQA